MTRGGPLCSTFALGRFRRPEERDVTWIFVMMFWMIVGSIVIEWLLPMKAKQPLGVAACWVLMVITMAFLGSATIGLVLVIVDSYIYDFGFLTL